MINVIKRDGRKEPLNIEKIHRVVEWSCENITGVSVSQIELESQLQFFNNITTKEIHETLIKAAANLIEENTPNYQYVAGRLINYQLRKEVYGNFNPDHLHTHYTKVVKEGYYDKALDELYNNEEWEELNQYIKHDRDDAFTYAAMEQFRGKYLVKDRTKNKIYETPQIAFMLIAMTLFSGYSKNERLKWVKELYDALSTFDISLPTPIMAGVRTPQRQFSSCVLIETDDSLNSISATSASIIKYISQKAGIGIGAGRIRAIESPVGGGVVNHTGVIPFYKHFQSAIKSCSQGGVRSGAGTLYCPLWHYEIEDILVLKNNKGTEDNRARHLDYGIQFNKTMYERLINGENITLFSPHDVPDLYEAFFTNNELFKELYEKYERKNSVRKKVVPAIDLFSSFMQERKDTGRIYLQNVDHSNNHGSFIAEEAPIRMSNLCAEITLPTQPLSSIDDGKPEIHTLKMSQDEYKKYIEWKLNNSGMLNFNHLYPFKFTVVKKKDNILTEDHVFITEVFESESKAEISLCTLAAINWGRIKRPGDFEKPCTLAVRVLDALLDYQDYPVTAAYRSTMNRRPLGVGIINFAYWLAKNNVTYSTPDLDLIHEYAEAWSYYLIKASSDLAVEKGDCNLSNQTKYHQGILPIDTYKVDVDELTDPVYRMDWDSLRMQLKENGIRNSTLMALMPSETSSQVSNSTNGIEPPRSLVSVKQSRDGVLKQVVPEIAKLKNKYELLWDQQSPEGYLKIVAVLQKFIDQSISTNTSYNPVYYPEEKVPMSEMLKHLLMCYKYGIKTLYYCNTNDGSGEVEVSQDNNEITIESEPEVCDGCAI